MFRSHQRFAHYSLLALAAAVGSACDGDSLTIGKRMEATAGNGSTEQGGDGTGAHAAGAGSDHGGDGDGIGAEAGAGSGGNGVTSATGATSGAGGFGGGPLTGGAGGTGGSGAAAGTGGSGAAAGTGGSGAAAGTGGSGAAAGVGGAEPNDCDGGLRSYPDCGTCTKTIDEHCGAGGCLIDQSQICGDTAYYGAWDRGCGYLRHRFDGDVGDHRVELWDEATGQLVYLWDNGARSMGCYADTRVGVEPDCAEWAQICPSEACSGLAGEWTVSPLVTERTNESEVADSLPAVGAPVDEIGLFFWEQEGSCYVEWRPLWGRTGSAQLASESGNLVAAIPEDTETGWCGWLEWTIDQLVATPGATPTVSIASRVSQLADDIASSTNVQAQGSLLPGLPPVALRGAVNRAEGNQPCLDASSTEDPLSVLPWSQITVGSSQPLDTLADHLSATLDGVAFPIGWTAPSDLNDLDRLAVSQLRDWDSTMGKVLRVSADTSPTEEVLFTVLELPVDTAYVDASLAALVTQGTRELETSSGTTTLHLTGPSCGAGVSAAGLLDATGASEVWVELQILNDPRPRVGVDVIYADTRRQAAELTTAEDAPLLRYAATLDGGSVVGFQITASGGCQAETWSNPDIRILGIGTE